MKHLPYGGSTIRRTLNCPAWRKLADTMPPSPSSSFADEGTLLHNCAEEYYKEPAKGMLRLLVEGRNYNGAVLTQELLQEKLKPAIEAVYTQLDSIGIAGKDTPDSYVCEPFVELTPDKAGGSIDMLAVSDDKKTVMVLDYKFGFNQVEVEANDQLMFYALCADLDPLTAPMFEQAETLRLVIVQPKADGPTESVYECPIDSLDAFETRVIDAIELCEASDGTDTCAGDWCKYCPAEAICPSKTGAASEALKLDPMHLPTLAQALDFCDQLEPWIKAARKLGHDQAEQGVKIEGRKLVAKRARRVYTDQEAVEKYVRLSKRILKADAYDITLKTPAKLEKVFIEKEVDYSALDLYIESRSSGTTLAKASDKRPEATPLLALEALAGRL